MADPPHPHTQETGVQAAAVTQPDDAASLRDLRKAAGLTQGQLGEYAGVTRQTIAAIEKGDYAPSVYLALRIARRLGSTVEHLFPLDKEPS